MMLYTRKQKIVHSQTEVEPAVFCKLFSVNGAGFTLIEALVAVAIIGLAVGGPIYTANRSLVAAQVASNKLTAAYLAQEVVEYARAVRDNEFLALYPSNTPSAWDNFTNLPLVTSCTSIECTVNLSGGQYTPCDMSSPCLPLYLDAGDASTPRRYVQLGGTLATTYVRTIQFLAPSATERDVIGKVMWSYRGQNYTVSVIDHLTAWQ